MKNPSNLTAKGLARCEKLLDAAGKVFLHSGFEKASLNEIINISGGSLSTIYKVFGNKEGLFKAFLEYKSSEIFEDLSKNLEKERDLEKFLYKIGEKFLSLVVTDEAILFHRLIIAEGYRNDAKLGNMFVKSAAGFWAQAISERLIEAKKRDEIEVEDPLLASYQFLDAIKGPFLFHLVLGVKVDSSKEAQERALRQLVKIFMKGFAKTN